MKISQIGILTAAVAWLLLSMADAWAIEDIVKDIVDQRDRTPFEQIVAETLTFEEFAELAKIKQKFEARENNEKERQMQCVVKGGHPQICVDPHWCLYPSNEKKSECVKYYVKLGLF
jgi:hypothetical protein